MAFHRLFRGKWLILTVGLTVIASADAASGAMPAEPVTLLTRDGVQLRLTYFPSSARKGTADAKQVTPVILLHDSKESRAVFNMLAQRLQAVGGAPNKGPTFAAVTVDLRGHGDSTSQNAGNGGRAVLDAGKLGKGDLINMAAYDMEAVRSFLIEKNDAGELNLNKLCIIGSGMGTNVAVNWALQDWASPPLAIGKQGQDVKALVLISPRWTYNGLSFQRPMKYRPLKQNVAWMLLYGAQDTKVKADAERIQNQLERFHPAPEKTGAKAPSSFQMEGYPSKLQGSTLLKQTGDAMDQKIITFLLQQVGNTQQSWSSRIAR